MNDTRNDGTERGHWPWRVTPAMGRFVLLSILKIFLYNTAIAIFLTAVVAGTTLRYSFIYSQSIGLGIGGVILLACLVRGKTRPKWGDVVMAVVFGSTAGFVIGTWGNGLTLAQMFRENTYHVIVSGTAGLTFGVIAAVYFFMDDRLRLMNDERQKERLKRLEYEAALSQSELRLLQAQIEPHFLFNTLSNIASLVGGEPEKARTMLYNLVAILRVSLERTRARSYKLSEEIAILRAYLGIMEVRMENRLHWNIDVDAALWDVEVPPLIIQPLVENAIRHGLEPKGGAGRLDIKCHRVGDRLVVSVEDDGVGMNTHHKGTGLSNVARRIEAHFGKQERGIELLQPVSGGLAVRLSMPIVKESGHHA